MYVLCHRGGRHCRQWVCCVWPDLSENPFLRLEPQNCSHCFFLFNLFSAFTHFWISNSLKTSWGHVFCLNKGKNQKGLWQWPTYGRTAIYTYESFSSWPSVRFVLHVFDHQVVRVTAKYFSMLTLIYLLSQWVTQIFFRILDLVRSSFSFPL